LASRWDEVCRMYAQVNQLLGDIVKVTPTSKAVGDLALFLVTNNLTADAVLDPSRDLAYPESVIDLLAGRMGQNPGGFPPQVQERILRGTKPVQGRPGESLPPADFAAAAATVEKLLGREANRQEVVTYLLYPRVYQDFVTHMAQFSDISMLPTPFFLYGQQPGEELTIDIEKGKTLIIRFLTVSEPHADGTRTVFFELNGQPREVRVEDKSVEGTLHKHPKADPDDASHVAAPMPGKVSTVAVKKGQAVKAGERLLSIEAMKMETAIYSPRDSKVADILVSPGSVVETKDLLVVLE